MVIKPYVMDRKNDGYLLNKIVYIQNNTVDTVLSISNDK